MAVAGSELKGLRTLDQVCHNRTQSCREISWYWRFCSTIINITQYFLYVWMYVENIPKRTITERTVSRESVSGIFGIFCCNSLSSMVACLQFATSSLKLKLNMLSMESCSSYACLHLWKSVHGTQGLHQWVHPEWCFTPTLIVNPQLWVDSCALPWTPFY